MGLGLRLGFPYYDLDEEVERRVGLGVRFLIEEYGEEYFRAIEEEVLRGLCGLKGSMILATGGGSILSGLNRGVLKERGYNFLLRVGLGEIYERLRKDMGGRGRLVLGCDLKEELRILERERRSLYGEVKDEEVEASGGVGEVVEYIAGRVFEVMREGKVFLER